MTTWFLYSLGYCPHHLLQTLAKIPGISIKKRGESVTAPANAAWMVEELCAEAGVKFHVRPLVPHVEVVRDAALENRGVREWVPEFLTSYQREGLAAMSARSGLFFWAAGSGKTLGAIVWALEYRGPTVVVTRASVRRSYGREIERFTHHRALVIEDTAQIDQDTLEEYRFAVLGWETLPYHVDNLIKWKPAAVVFDEIHKAKNNKRFQAIPGEDGKLTFKSRDNIAYAAMQLSRATPYRLGTTATPIKDRVRDLWAQLDLIEPNAWGPYFRDDTASFTDRYCGACRNPFGGIDTGGATNLDELWSRVSLSVHQVPHSVTHRDLPPRRRVVTTVSKLDQSAPTGGFVDELKKASKNGKTAILEIRLAEAASRKRAVVVERVMECLEGNQKVLVFTGRRRDCDKLTAAVTKAAGDTARVYSGHGGTAAKDRDAIQQQYMADPGPCVLIGTGDAWGEGVNLQDTDTFLVVMLPFTPGQIVQWEGRVARHGQTRPVLIEYLLAEGTVDDHVGQVLLQKLPAVEEVAKDDSITGFAGALQGLESEEQIVDSVFAMLAAQ